MSVFFSVCAGWVSVSECCCSIRIGSLTGRASQVGLLLSHRARGKVVKGLARSPDPTGVTCSARACALALAFQTLRCDRDT